MLASDSPEIPGVDMRAEAQLSLVNRMEGHFDEFERTILRTPGRRYSPKNDQYLAGDAAMLYAMIRHFQPRRIIEIGSGHSSAVMLDVNECGMGRSVELTFIEPYPERLRSLIREADASCATLLEQTVQTVDPSVFDVLEDGDFLFVDSSHVSKAGSDVNHIAFEILPRLKPGTTTAASCARSAASAPSCRSQCRTT
jgi:predicted O-methyltransferase YrrM